MDIEHEITRNFLELVELEGLRLATEIWDRYGLNDDGRVETDIWLAQEVVDEARREKLAIMSKLIEKQEETVALVLRDLDRMARP